MDFQLVTGKGSGNFLEPQKAWSQSGPGQRPMRVNLREFAISEAALAAKQCGPRRKPWEHASGKSEPR